MGGETLAVRQGASRAWADLAGPALFRILFGLLITLAVVRYFANGWIAAQYEQPRLFFAYEGFGWVKPLPAPWMSVLFAAIGVSGLLVALGLFYRPAIVVLTAGFTWAHLCDKTNYLNHYYLVSLVGTLMCFVPLHGALSIDARRRPSLRAPGLSPDTLRLLRFQVALVYVFAGLAKLGPDWLLRAQPLRTWLLAAEGVPFVGPILGEKATAFAASWAAAAFDLFIPFFLLCRRTWVPAFAAVVLFHAATALLFPIGLFPWFMVVFATLLLPADWPRRWLSRWLRGWPPPPGPDVPAPAPGRGWRVAAIAWGIVQLVVPMRFLVLPDDVLWAERGFRFSWRVMLVDKVGSVTFRVRDPVDGRTWEVFPSSLLTPVQERMMSTQPDMIADLARRVAAMETARTGHDVEVRVDALVAFNGRPSRRLVDPSVDVARSAGVPRGWVTAPP